MEKYKKLSIAFFSLVFLFFSFSFVFAAPVTNINTAAGIQIEAPIYDTHTQNLSYKFNFHLFNITDGIPLTNSTPTTCLFHLYNTSGNHLFKAEYVSAQNKGIVFGDEQDFEVFVAAGNFSKTGEYRYVFQCNKSIIGGFIENPIHVTSDGISVPIQENNTNSNQLIFFVILLSIVIAITIFGIAWHDISITIFGAFAMTLLGLYMLNTGIPPYRTQLTQWLAIIIMAIGGFVGIKAAFDYFGVGGNND